MATATWTLSTKGKLFVGVCKIGTRDKGILNLPFLELIKEDERINNGTLEQG